MFIKIPPPYLKLLMGLIGINYLFPEWIRKGSMKKVVQELEWKLYSNLNV
jgi:hypothetical protein